MALETTESFLEVLKKSKLLTGEQLDVAAGLAGQAAGARALAVALVKKELLTRWQANQLLAGRTGFFWGKYKFVDLLGRGGMGSVFLAWHTMMNRAVALKIISRELGQDPAALERFFIEARAVAALDHPNIVHAYDVANEADRYFMVMEYVEGRDLQRMVEKQGPLECAQAVDYIRQAAEGLAHAHSRDMVHCDVKPANLLVNQQGLVKILDMGMARAVGRKANSVGAGEGAPDDQAVLGTVDYMAPEQGLGIEKADRRSDIYSLGCTFYFLLTGQPPFPAGTLAQRIVKHQTEEPKDIAEIRPDTPAELLRICRKMMAKDPGDRFQTADEVAQLLAEWHPSPTKILRATPLEEEEEVVAEEAMPAEEAVAVAAQKMPAKAAPARKPAAKEPAAKKPVAKEPAAAARIAAQLVARTKEFVDYVIADRRRMMIWGGSGGAVLVLLLGGLMWWIAATVKAGRQEPKGQVAQKAASGKDAKAKDGNFDDFVPAWERNGPEKADAGKDDAAKAAPEKPGMVGPPPKPGGPPPKPGGPPPIPGTSASPPPTKAAASSPATPAPPKTPAKDKKAEPEKKPPAEKKTEAPKKTEPAKPAAPKPAPAKTAPPAAPADALAGFKSVPFVELPPIGEAGAGEFGTGPTLVGKVTGPEDKPITIQLLGKDTALKNKRQQFSLEQKEADGKKQVWVVRLDTQGKDDSSLEVATFFREKGELFFRWADKAAEASGEYLQNCALEMQGGGEPHIVVLRKPAVAEPIVLDLQKGIATGSVTIDPLPDLANLRVELTKVVGEAGPLKLDRMEGPIFKSGSTMEIKTPASLAFARKDLRGHQLPGVEFEVKAIPKGRGLAITIRLASPTAQQYKSALAYAAATRMEAELKSRGLPNQFAAAKDEAQKAKIATDFEKYASPLWYEEFYKQVHRNARLHFQVFLEAGDRRIVLASTEVPK